MSKGRRSPTAVALAALLVIPALTACGSSGKKIDHAVVESAIEAKIAKERRLASVAQCPAGVTAEKKAQFACRVTLMNGTVSNFLVEQTDDAGNLRFVAAGTRGK